jgi:NAD(P)H-hydrate epimerase
MARLLGKTTAGVESDRLGAARSLAQEYGHWVVLKGARTLIADPRGETYLNPTGNPGMATAGIGDALTGVIAAFLAQGLSPLEAALAGTYVHGTAGDLAASEKGHRGLITRDLIEKLPAALCQLEQFQPGEFEETAPV